MMKAGFLICVSLFVVHAVFADEVESLFYQANKYYEDGNYEAAAQLYEKIVAAKKENWQLFYNLGNSYFKLHEVGKAIYNYERALALSPRNEDVRYNLEIANLSIVDRIPDPPKQPFVIWVETLFLAPSFAFFLWATLILYVLAMLSWAAKYFWTGVRNQPFYRAVLWLEGTGLLVIALVFCFRWYKMETERTAIILAHEVNVTSSPTENATEVFVLHEGTKLQIQEQSGVWVRIRLRDGKVGWVPLKTLGEI